MFGVAFPPAWPGSLRRLWLGPSALSLLRWPETRLRQRVPLRPFGPPFHRSLGFKSRVLRTAGASGRDGSSTASSGPSVLREGLVRTAARGLRPAFHRHPLTRVGQPGGLGPSSKMMGVFPAEGGLGWRSQPVVKTPSEFLQGVGGRRPPAPLRSGPSSGAPLKGVPLLGPLARGALRPSAPSGPPGGAPTPSELGRLRLGASQLARVVHSFGVESWPPARAHNRRLWAF